MAFLSAQAVFKALPQLSQKISGTIVFLLFVSQKTFHFIEQFCQLRQLIPGIFALLILAWVDVPEEEVLQCGHGITLLQAQHNTTDIE